MRDTSRSAHSNAHSQISSLKLIPSRIVSRVYGAANTVTLPVNARTIIYRTWAWFFHAALHEAGESDLTTYPHLQAFFTRTLVAGVRPIAVDPALVSPCDGRVVSLSSVASPPFVLSQVKGVEYYVSDFLGVDVPQLQAGNALHSAVIYLSPGDYHRFHSPTEWVATSRAHFAGQLLPVNPVVARLLPALFCANERVALLGSWRHGFFSYTAVGATNVGSIRVNFDAELTTNSFRHDWGCGFSAWDAAGMCGGAVAARRAAPLADACVYEPPVPLARGSEVGHFCLGSTIVLVFEAPTSFRWAVSAGDVVRYGEPLGTVPSPRPAAAVDLHPSSGAAIRLDSDFLPGENGHGVYGGFPMSIILSANCDEKDGDGPGSSVLSGVPHRISRAVSAATNTSCFSSCLSISGSDDGDGADRDSASDAGDSASCTLGSDTIDDSSPLADDCSINSLSNGVQYARLEI